MRLDALGRVAWREVRLQPPAALIRQILDHKSASPPSRAACGDDLADREPNQRRDLLRSFEVMMRRRFQSLALERDHALIAVHVAARIDGEGQMPMAEQVAAGVRRGLELFPVEPSERTQMRGGVEIDQKHGDGAIAFGLQLKAASRFQCRAKQRRQRHRFAHQPRHGLGIVVALQQEIDRCA